MEDKHVKICPILTIAGTIVSEGIKHCEQEECEFWCEWTNSCAVTTIAGHLGELRR